MAIIRIEPPDFEHEQEVSVYSDADTNMRALIEIGDWAADHGLVRSQEYALPTVQTDGKRLFKGLCYRMTAEDYRRARAIIDEVKAARASMPITRPLRS
jgi:hypothetical protein